MKKTILKIFIWTAGIFALLCVAAAVAVAIVFSPQTVRRIVCDAAQSSINGQVLVKDAQASIFNTFPHLTFRLDSVSINADDGQRLMQASHIEIAVNWWKFIDSRQIAFKKILIEEPAVAYSRTLTGESSWDGLFKSSPESADTSSVKISSLSGSLIDIKGGSVRYDNALKGHFMSASETDISISGGIGKSGAGGRASINIGALTVRDGGLVSVNGKPFEGKVTFGFRRDSMSCNVSKAILSIGGISIEGSGKLEFNEDSSIFADIEYGLKVKSLAEIAELIPKSIIPQAEDVNASGALSSNGIILGTYSKDEFPYAKGTLAIISGSISYPGMPASLDNIEMSLEYGIDPNRQQKSFVHLDTITVSGKGVHINGHGYLADLLDNPRLFSKFTSDIDLKKLYSIFPFADDISLDGTIDIDLTSGFAIKDISNGDFGKIRASGHFNMDSVVMSIPSDSIRVKISKACGHLGSNRKNTQTLQGIDMLKGDVGINTASIEIRNGLRVYADSLYAAFSTSPVKDSSMIASMTAQAHTGLCRIYLKDTLFLGVKCAEAKASLLPRLQNPKLPKIGISLLADSVRARYINSRLGVDKADIDLTLYMIGRMEGKAAWVPQGSVDVKRMRVFTPSFPVSIVTRKASFEFDRNSLKMYQAAFRIGQSDMTFTGRIDNLWSGIYKSDTIKAKMEMTSRKINLNQILRANAKGRTYRTDIQMQKALLAADDNIDSTASLTVTDTSEFTASGHMPVIPAYLNLDFDAQISKLRLGKMNISDFNSRISVRNGAIQLDSLSLSSEAVGSLKGLAMYQCRQAKNGYAGFELEFDNVIIDSLVKTMPAIDSIVPMLRSMKGNVSIFMAGQSELNESMTPIFSTIRSGLHLEGKNVTLLDGETFAEIAKRLKFQNKKRNLIDSIAVNLSFNAGTLEIFPFVLSMDRYLIAAGGIQRMNSSYDYHISLLDSPIVFRVGIDVSGSRERKMKFKITNAKYKDVRQATRRSYIDSTAFMVRMNISDRLKGIEYR